MTLAELQKTLRAADPRAVLVSPRVLERIIVEAHDLHGPSWTVPHRKCHIVDRQTLFRHVEQTDLHLEPDQLLPDTVILLARPPAEQLSDLERSHVLLTFWRRLFHAAVHLALSPAGNSSTNPLSSQRLADHIVAIGRTEFEEIREVLSQDRFLLDNADDRSIYIEFAAVYLETRHFAPELLAGVFPGLRDRGKIDRMLAEEVDSQSLFDATRLVGAPDPQSGADSGTSEAESQERYWLMVRGAEKLSLEGNAVRAAILRTRAWRIAPAALGNETRQAALADLRRLSDRLAVALSLAPEPAGQWAQILPLLLDKADQGNRPAEARLLEDLQKVCLDHERDMYTLDPIEWALSAGRRPVKRPLPGLRPVRITRHLRAATRHLGAVRLDDADRQRLSTLVQTALAEAEAGVRERFGKVLTSSLHDAGLRPSNTPERVAFVKMVEEWLDRIISQGFLTFSDLRDGVSRNQLKMPDLVNPEDFIRGDPLLRLDRRLASLLDGVYRPSELYMRWLERLTALNFGTRLGRLITLWFTIPVGGAMLLLQVLGVLMHLVADPEDSSAARSVHSILVGPWLHHAAAGEPPEPMWVWHVLLLAILASFIFSLVHVKRVRIACKRAAVATGRWLRFALIETPIKLYRRAELQQIFRSWPFQLLWWYGIKPMAVTAILWLLVPPIWRGGGTLLFLFLGTAIMLNSRLGEAAAKATAETAVSFATLVRAGLLPGLYRLILQVFRQVIDGIELVFFTIDDWLRFRTGESQASLVTRTILATLWYPIHYLARFYVVVLIEPGFNPIKAPVSYMAAKVMLPFGALMTTTMVESVRPFLWDWLAYTVVVPTVWLLPDVFGFLFWETKENWSLYRSNRRQTLRAVAVGPHAETIKGLLQPGFHSGTIPRLYARLRRAERDALRSRNWSAVRATKHELEEIASAVERFADRELVALLNRNPHWQNEALQIGSVTLSVNRIGIDLIRRARTGSEESPSPSSPHSGGLLKHEPSAAGPVTLCFELRLGLLVASVPQSGWLRSADEHQAHSLAVALACFYKLAGIDVVREQVEANQPSPNAEWNITPQGLVITAPSKSADAPAQTFVYNPTETIDPPADLPRMVFAQMPVFWKDWLASWTAAEGDAGGDAPVRWAATFLPRLSTASGNGQPEFESEHSSDRQVGIDLATVKNANT